MEEEDGGFTRISESWQRSHNLLVFLSKRRQEEPFLVCTQSKDKFTAGFDLQVTVKFSEVPRRMVLIAEADVKMWV